jgi:hypothetical protein
MQWAEGGSLDDFIDVRQGRSTRQVHVDPSLTSFFAADEPAHISTPSTPNDDPRLNTSSDILSRSARIRAFRAFQRAPPEEQHRLKQKLDAVNSMRFSAHTLTPVHLLSAEEISSLFKDVVEGLAFLVGGI